MSGCPLVVALLVAPCPSFPIGLPVSPYKRILSSINSLFTRDPTQNSHNILHIKSMYVIFKHPALLPPSWCLLPALFNSPHPSLCLGSLPSPSFWDITLLFPAGSHTGSPLGISHGSSGTQFSSMEMLTPLLPFLQASALALQLRASRHLSLFCCPCHCPCPLPGTILSL